MLQGGISIFKYIVNEDIELKLPTMSDAEGFYSIINSSRVYLSEWLPWIKFTRSIEDIKGFISNAQKQFAEDNGFKAIIMYKGEYAGLIGYHYVDWDRRSANIGYWLGEAYQKKGIMTEVLRVFIDYAFNEMNMNKIEIPIAEQNHKSRALPEKFGFTVEGKIRDAEWLNNRYVDHILYGLLKKEWNK